MINELANNAISEMTRDQKTEIVSQNVEGFEEMKPEHQQMQVDQYFENLGSEEKKMLVGIE